MGGGVRVSQIQKSLESCQTAGPIDPKFGTHLQIHLGMDIRQTNCLSIHNGALGGFRDQTLKNRGSCQTAGPIGINFGSRLRIDLGTDTG